MNPLISIIIPLYNMENSVKVTIDSLLDQDTDELYEVIVINDGSTDNTLEIVQSAFDTSEFTNYKVINKTNGGVSSARNRGILEATGIYIIFLDGDDYVSKDLVNNIYKYSNNHAENDIICWGFDVVKENHNTIISYFQKYEQIKKNMTGVETLKKIICNNTLRVWTGSLALKKNFLFKIELLFTEGCTNGEDQEFIYKAISRAKNVTFINKTLSYYLIREGSISNSYNISKFDAINAMVRTYHYIYDSNDTELKKIANIIRTRYVIGNYLSNISLCYKYSNNKKPQKIFDEIESSYPHLNKQMLHLMKNNKDRNIKFLFRIKLFLFSPVLFLKFMNLIIKK